ncbi:MAG: PepSY-associated TM helix domain-containing protein [Pseudomonadota bacterium]
MTGFGATYDLYTGELLSDHVQGPIFATHSWLSGAHYIQFDHWPLRWLYFLGGLCGCVMIASGNIFWMRARMRKSGEDPIKVRVVRALTIGATTGIVAGSAAFLIVNRMLSDGSILFGADRSELEVWGFFIVWILSFAHAALTGKRAWSAQIWLIAAFGVIAVALNWITTGDHIFEAAGRGLWSVAGMDLVLLSGSAVAISAAFRLRKTDRLKRNDQSRLVRATRDAAE